MKRFRWKRPFLENSTAYQKSTPDMFDNPGRAFSGLVGGSFVVKMDSEDAVRGPGFSIGCRAALVNQAFMESLILAQDERWRRA